MIGEPNSTKERTSGSDMPDMSPESLRGCLKGQILRCSCFKLHVEPPLLPTLYATSHKPNKCLIADCQADRSDISHASCSRRHGNGVCDRVHGPFLWKLQYPDPGPPTSRAPRHLLGSRLGRSEWGEGLWVSVLFWFRV